MHFISFRYHVLTGVYSFADFQNLSSSDMLPTSLQSKFLHLSKENGVRWPANHCGIIHQTLTITATDLLVLQNHTGIMYFFKNKCHKIKGMVQLYWALWEKHKLFFFSTTLHHRNLSTILFISNVPVAAANTRQSCNQAEGQSLPGAACVS